MKEKRVGPKWLYWFSFAIAVILVYKAVDNISGIGIWLGKFISVIMPFLIAILLSYLFYIPAKKIEELYKKVKMLNKRSRGLSVLTVYIIAILIIIIIINTMIPALSKSLVDLANSLPEYYNRAMEFVDNMSDNSIIKKESAEKFIYSLQEIDITKMISLDNISDYIKGALGVASEIFSIFLTIIMSIYILLERERIVNFIKRLNKALFKEETCKAIDKYFSQANTIFFKFISSQILDGLIVGIIVSIAMYFLNVKYWVLLGFMIGLFNIIPYFGAIISVAAATIITIFTGGISKALLMLIVVIILQQIDANIINPKIVGNALKLSPILVIFSVTVAGAYFGVLGMFLAVPVIAIIKILINDFIEYRTKNKS